jgi:hypothetical protein
VTCRRAQVRSNPSDGRNVADGRARRARSRRANRTVATAQVPTGETAVAARQARDPARQTALREGGSAEQTALGERTAADGRAIADRLVAPSPTASPRRAQFRRRRRRAARSSDDPVAAQRGLGCASFEDALKQLGQLLLLDLDRTTIVVGEGIAEALAAFLYGLADKTLVAVELGTCRTGHAVIVASGDDEHMACPSIVTDRGNPDGQKGTPGSRLFRSTILG